MDPKPTSDPRVNQPHRRHDFRFRVPEGDERPRWVCERCDWVHYVNPVVVVGVVATWEDRVLLCRRAIGPREGYWTIPAGFLEEEESVTAGALREAVEEANAEVAIDALLGVYDIPRISQVQLIFRGRLASERVHPGPESREARLFPWTQIPWDELAFPSVRWALEHHEEVRGVATFPPFRSPAGFTA